jgi:mannose-6-phosphate isomerase-like protein (cupin superfamily)
VHAAVLEQNSTGIIRIDQNKITWPLEHEENVTFFVQEGFIKFNYRAKILVLRVGDSFMLHKNNSYTIENPSNRNRAYVQFKYHDIK